MELDFRWQSQSVQSLDGINPILLVNPEYRFMLDQDRKIPILKFSYHERLRTKEDVFVNNILFVVNKCKLAVIFTEYFCQIVPL